MCAITFFVHIIVSCLCPVVHGLTFQVKLMTYATTLLNIYSWSSAVPVVQQLPAWNRMSQLLVLVVDFVLTSQLLDYTYMIK